METIETIPLAEAINRGLTSAYSQSLQRYGYADDLFDVAKVGAWLAANPRFNYDYPLPEEKTVETAVRPNQDRFRKEVGEAYGWRCALTGCDEPSALDAAHLRSWRKGNTINDGILLRADLHRLLDSGKMTIDKQFVAHVSSSCYRELDGKRIRLPKERQDWPRLD